MIRIVWDTAVFHCISHIRSIAAPRRAEVVEQDENVVFRMSGAMPAQHSAWGRRPGWRRGKSEECR